MNIGHGMMFMTSAAVALHVFPGGELGPGARCAETVANERRAAEGVLETRATATGSDAAMPQRVVHLHFSETTTGRGGFLLIRRQLHRCLVSCLQLYRL